MTGPRHSTAGQGAAAAMRPAAVSTGWSGGVCRAVFSALCGVLALSWSPRLAAQPAAEAPAQVVEIEAKPLSDTELRRRDPVAKQVYGREEIEKYGDTNLSEVLKRLPGVNVTGGSPRMRGLGAGYTQILVNGEPAPPGFSLDNLSPELVERIEVTKGPSAEHSAQAVAGTINIILREPPRERQRELRLGLGYTAQWPTPSFNGTWGDRSGALSWTVPVAVFSWRNATHTETERLSLDAVGDRLWRLGTSDSRSWGGGVNIGPRLTWRLSGRDTLGLQGFAQRGEFNNRGLSLTEALAGLPPISVDDDWYNRGHWQNLQASGQWTRRHGDGARLELKAGLQANESAYRTDVVGRDADGVTRLTRLSTGRNDERRSSTSGKWQQPVGEHHTLALGWDLERRHRREVRSQLDNGVPALSDYDNEPFLADITRTALFAQDEWEIAPRWASSLGLRVEELRLSSRGSDGTLTSRSRVWSPLLHLTHRFDPKGRDLLRLSLTRSYKAPEPSALLGRPSVNLTDYPKDGPNAESSPDRTGNPSLRPELSTGLDVALERYFGQGGLVSVGLFHKRITGLIRQATTLEAVPWASVPRWVSRPINYPGAVSTGLELEVKGRAGDLLPAGWVSAPPPALDLRASLGLYRSRIDDLPGPDDRLDQQAPWALTLGVDQRLSSLPLGWGATLALGPAWRVQQTERQSLDTGRTRSLDLYLLWTFSRQSSLRLGLNNAAPVDNTSRTVVVPLSGEVQTSSSRRNSLTTANLGWTLKF